MPRVTPGTRSNLRALLDRAFAAHGLVPRNVGDVESRGTLIRIAESGEARTILPRSAAAVHGTHDRPAAASSARRCAATSRCARPRTAASRATQWGCPARHRRGHEGTGDHGSLAGHPPDVARAST
ncbi:hypothetical protein ACFYWS_13225 [Streptomyces sp. NPDC002795]|uniref:hypothetical protein n=1 Tax=Streptomyces sp. NPDC002795 TaxID=3364665 RepID=UPI0036C2AD9C